MYDSLIELGLSPIDAIVYELLVGIGPCFVAPLVARTKKHRQIIYNALESLEKRKLVVVLKKNGKNHYAIGDPQHLLTELAQKEVLAKNVVHKVLEKTKLGDEHVEVFSGTRSYLEGIADFRMRAMEAQEYIAIRGECKGWFDFFKPHFEEHVSEVKKIKRAGIPIFILFFENERDKAEEFILPHLHDPYVCKIAPNESKLPHTAWLAGEHVFIVTPAVDPIIVHIKSKALSDQYREYFYMIWEKAELLTTEVKPQ